MLTSTPNVSILIPMRNEASYIGNCLESILATTYPLKHLEIIILDANSTDDSKQIVADYSTKHPNIKLIDNPGLIVSKGLNIGIKQASGEIIIRMDAHAIYDKHYITESVELLLTSDAKNVGGVVKPIGQGYVGKAIALALRSKFGVGDAKYRYATKEQYVDTIWCGCWYKKVLEKLGGFDEQWIVNQDSELNNRILKSGGKLLISPKIKCDYFVRDSLGKLAKQYFRYGYARVNTILQYPQQLRLRQIIPPVFLILFIITLILCLWTCWPFTLLNGIYLLVSITFSVSLSITHHGLKLLPILPIIFAIIHFCWSSGFLLRLFSYIFNPTTKNG